MAPEIILNQDYDEKVDIWALGVISFAILTSQYPFNGSSKEELFQMIVS